MTNFFDVVTSMGVPLLNGMPFLRNGYLFVDGVNGNDGFSGTSLDDPLKTVQAAVNKLVANMGIAVMPGDYDESVTIPVLSVVDGNALTNIVMWGGGQPGSARIKPTATNATALTNKADNFMMYGMGCSPPDSSTGAAMWNNGRKLQLYHCKLQLATWSLRLIAMSGADQAAGLGGDSSDSIIEDCEFAWSTNGIQFYDNGGQLAVTQVRFVRCRFHNHSASAFEEGNAVGGAVTTHFRNILVKDCSFEPAEDGTEPTKYFSLNDSNSNTGLVTGCRFTVALNSGKNLVSTAMIWSGNFHPAGLSTTQPS